MQKEIIAAIAEYLYHFTESTNNLKKVRFLKAVRSDKTREDFLQEIATEIAAAIAPLVEDVCPDCKGSGGVEIGEHEYSTCPCIAPLVEPGEVEIKDLQVGAKVKIIAKIDTSDRFSHHFQIGHLGTITRIDLSDPLYQYLIDDHDYGWVLAEEIELI